ncbi:M1 family metallopeptidase [Kribbella voronezhensis]|uniref:M1 family metallopeptidase n=1 Tax=Kribbella voronezhensis TaxID=2512212 RepID=UPI0010630F6C|nr:M1 family metallopeptidase [Kribbella voronezhensis]
MVDGHVKIFAAATKNLSRFNLDSYGLDIAEVRVDGSTESAVQDGEELVITPEWAIPSGRGFVVDITYKADPVKIKPPAGGWVATPDGFATAPQPSGADTIFPSNDHPSDKAQYVIRVTAPKGTIGVASGNHIGDQENADGSTTSTYATVNPMATELVQASVGDYTIVDRGTVDGARMRDVVPAARLAKVDPALKLTSAQLQWVKQYLGTFPLEAYGILPANSDAPDAFDFTGLETQTLTLYKPNYLAQAEDKIGSHMMHELVHNWFGNSVTPASWSDLWINEGHADYYALNYRYERGWPDNRGYKTMVDKMKYTYSQGDLWRASSGPVAKPNAKNLFDNQRYTGGVLVLYALREKVGAETFARIEQAVLADHRNGNISTDGYIDLATTVSGDPSVEPFLQDWLYVEKTPPMPNHPDWTVVPPTTKTLAATDLQSDRRGD